MSEVRPIRERELLIDDVMRAEFRDQIDPLINSAFEARGYTEEHTSSDHIFLDRDGVLASPAYIKYMGNVPFHGLKVRTTHDVFKNEHFLTKAQLELSRIGGFGKSRFIKNGTAYSVDTVTTNNDTSKDGPVNVPEGAVYDILQDIRAYTELGYSDSDVLVPIDKSIEELEQLSTQRRVDKRAHYQLLTSEDHGDIQMNIGESFELEYIQASDTIKRRRANIQKLFELVALQPVEDGILRVGALYRSSKNGIDMKLTTELVNTDYTDEAKQAYYNDVIKTHQEKDVRKFGQGIIKNLQIILDDNSDIVRLG